MQRGFAFKLMATKDIAQVFAMIDARCGITAENIEKPNNESASSMYQLLGEFAYDMDIQHVKARAAELQSVGGCMEIYDEAIDIVTVFKLARQLAYINRVEDFNFKDIWDPQAKRLRPVLSGIINFCRYKETQTNVIASLKKDFQEIDNTRLELVERSNVVAGDFAEAQAQHIEELPAMYEAESAKQESQSMVDKLQKQKQSADKLHETAETKSEATKERLSDNEKRAERLRETTASLQEQVAESPEGLDQEVKELQIAIRLQKARVEEKSDEKRARQQRVQALARLQSNVESYKGSLDKVQQAATARAVAQDRTRGATNELAAMRATLEARRTEEVELGQAMEQVTQDMEDAKQTHADQVQECEDRRKLAVEKQEELQGKRTEEQRQWDTLQAKRAEFETEIGNVKRSHETQLNDFQTSFRNMQEDGEAYIHTVEGLMAQCDDEAGRVPSVAGCRPTCMTMASPGSARGRRRSGVFDMAGGFSASPSLKTSPAPRRLQMERAGY